MILGTAPAQSNEIKKSNLHLHNFLICAHSTCGQLNSRFYSRIKCGRIYHHRMQIPALSKRQINRIFLRLRLTSAQLIQRLLQQRCERDTGCRGSCLLSRTHLLKCFNWLNRRYKHINHPFSDINTAGAPPLTEVHSVNVALFLSF